jgi:hypothetical protein
MFTIVNAVLLRPMPVESPEELVLLFNGTEESPYGSFSYPDFLDYREGSDAFRGLAAFGEIQVSLAAEGSPEEIPAAPRGLLGRDGPRPPGETELELALRRRPSRAGSAPRASRGIAPRAFGSPRRGAPGYQPGRPTSISRSRSSTRRE